MKINHDTVKKNSVTRTLKKLGNERSVVAHVRNRLEWHTYPRLYHVKDFPIHVDIEPTSHCQLKCHFCFREHRKIENEGIMSLDLYKRLIDEMEGKVYSLKFTGRGEPLINKRFVEFVRYLDGKEFGEVALITNGQLLNEELMHAMIDTGFDRVAFSIDGLKEEYEKIRKPITYEHIYSVVSTLHRLREERGKKKPLIRIQGVNQSVTDEKKFLSIWEPVSDDIQLLVFKDYAEEARTQPQADYACPLLYQRMMVHWNGTVPMCINDEYEEGVVGDVHEASVFDVWHGKKFNAARYVHEMGKRDQTYRNCAKCALHREGHGYGTVGAYASKLITLTRGKPKLAR